MVPADKTTMSSTGSLLRLFIYFFFLSRIVEFDVYIYIYIYITNELVLQKYIGIIIIFLEDVGAKMEVFFIVELI